MAMLGNALRPHQYQRMPEVLTSAPKDPRSKTIR
jgi:hypothetical protein